MGVLAGVGAFPESGCGCLLVGFGDSLVEVRNQLLETVAMNGVGELVDEDVLGAVGVTGEAEQVFFSGAGTS